MEQFEEFDNYMLGVAIDGKAFKPVIDNPNSAFSRDYTSTQNGIIKINPTLEGFQQFIYKNADNLNISADDYYSIVKKCAKEAKIKALSDKTLGNIRNEFIENSDKIYEWRQIFLTNSTTMNTCFDNYFIIYSLLQGFHMGNNPHLSYILAITIG